MPSLKTSRRNFLKTTGLVAGTMLAGQNARVHASSSDTIQIALVGCGGRGGGAVVNALSTKSAPLKLVAMSDAFEDRLNGCHAMLTEAFPDQVDVPRERMFPGYDGYKQTIDALRPGDVVILATPPGFRPPHVEYAVERGVHVFMEKPFATDSPGTRRIQSAAKKADQKNVKIACGLMWRHCKARQEAIERIHNGEIGDVILLRGYRMHPPYRIPPRLSRPDMSELEYQVRCFHYFDWIGASIFIDYCIHNFDVACWAKGAWPVSAIGMGGRTSPEFGGTGYDHYYTEFTFPDGSILTSHGRYMDNCFDRYHDYVQGSKGSAFLMENAGRSGARLYKNFIMKPENLLWSFQGPEPNPYQVEHDLFFDAIVNDKPYNEGHRAAEAQFTSMLSRAAINSGQIVTWDEIVNSDVELLPGGIDNITTETVPPFLPDEKGLYSCAIPGQNVKI